jgi:exopolysaccharide biosynthesis polyprenyl glycosylphosphotransferase
MVRQGFSKWFHRLTLAADALGVSAAVLAGYALRFSGWPVPVRHEVPGLDLYLQALPVVVAVTLLAYQYAGLYLERRGRSGVDEASALLRATTAAYLILLGITFFYRREAYSRVVIGFAWGFTCLGVGLLRALLQALRTALQRRGVGVSRLALVGLTATSARLADHVRRYPGLGYALAGCVSERPGAGPTWEGLPVLGELGGLEEIIRRERIDEVVIALPAEQHAGLEDLLINAAATGAAFKVVSDLFGIITQPLAVDEIYGIPVFALKASPLERASARALKRTFDLAVTLPALLVLSPVLLLTALAVKLTSRGPVFYRQERVGRGNRPFWVLKFRTMRADAETTTGPVWAAKDDPRRTPIGAFLRRTSLDELPQLFNVLSGEMSLVGPRPERPHFVDQFQRSIPRYLERHRVKAGITGWAQVHGLRGNTPIEERTRYDLWYVENWSLALDVKVLLRTALEVFHHEDAY